jgi:hypothetical protein
MVAVVKLMDAKKTRRRRPEDAVKKRNLVRVLLALFAPHREAWVELHRALLEVGLAVFEEIPFRDQRCLLAEMNRIYDFRGEEERTVAMVRLQMVFLEDEKAADGCIRVIRRALEANSQSQAVREAMLEEMPALLDCYESRGDEVGRLAEAIVTELEIFKLKRAYRRVKPFLDARQEGSMGADGD